MLLLWCVKKTSQKAAKAPKLLVAPQVLQEISKQLDLADSFDATFWAACLVAFYSFFRKANLLLQSREKSDDTLLLCWSDFRLFSWGVIMTVRWNKT